MYGASSVASSTCQLYPQLFRLQWCGCGFITQTLGFSIIFSNPWNVIEGNVQWLGNASTAIYAVIAVLITTSIGQPIILYIAALGNVPVELLESAKIDGANNWTIFKNIIWPLIMPTTLYIVVTTTINSFQIFALIQLMTSGGPNYATSTIMYQVYEMGIKQQSFGQASAWGVVLALIIALISAVQYKYFNRDID